MKFIFYKTIVSAFLLCLCIAQLSAAAAKNTTRTPLPAAKAMDRPSKPQPVQDTIYAKSAAEADSLLALSSPESSGFVKPGEAIRISVYPDTASFVNGFYTVDGEGRIYLPLLGKMEVSSMSEKAFLDTLKAVYINYLRYPNLQVRHLIRISLLGGYQRPGLYYIDPDNSIWDAVYLTGGTTREDGLKRMKWERSRQIVAEDIIPYYQSGKSLRSIGFKSGDQLWTPVEPKRSWWDLAFRDVFLSQVFPILTTTASLYVSYMMYNTYKAR